VDRWRLDQRRESKHGLAHLAADLDIFCHVRFYDDGIRATALGLEHWHRRANAEGAGHIAGGCNHAALAATDNHRFVRERCIVTFLDSRVKCIAIDVCDAERRHLRMAHQAGRTADWTACRAICGVSKTIPAKIHGTSRSHGPPASARRPLSTSARSRLFSPAKAAISRSSEAT